MCGPKKRNIQWNCDNDPGCFKCNNCHACNVVKVSHTFKSTNTKKVYTIRQHITCESKYVIYLSTCKSCHGQYIGKSIQEFKRRHSGHKQEIKNSYGGLGQHYDRVRGCGYVNVSIILIEKLDEETKSY